MVHFLRNFIFFSLLVFTIVNIQYHVAKAAIGVNFGMVADNLPAAGDVVGVYKQENIPLMRLFAPHPEALEALKGSGIKVAVGTTNDDVPKIAADINAAKQWVESNITPYGDVDFGWITLGNEMVPGPGSDSIPRAMDNMLQALNLAGLSQIKVSTVVSGSVLGTSYPPSAGDFSSESLQYMKDIVAWLATTNNPLLVNVYPYFAYVSDPTNVPLGYALFNPDTPVTDGEYTYYSLFEAMVDAFYAALEKNGGTNVALVVAETGWPNAGNEPHTSIQNAQTYNQNLINKMKEKGTPRRPSSILDILIFAMFDEDQKPAGVEQHWGLHYPTKEPVYQLTF